MRKKNVRKLKYDGSITVEASFVLSIILLLFASLIRYAYTVHDSVTGSMILEETMERARNNVDKEKTMDIFSREGSLRGNPRLFLGEYEIQLEVGTSEIKGDASAGDWHLHMERADLHPETFLRKQDALRKIKDRLEN